MCEKLKCNAGRVVLGSTLLIAEKLEVLLNVDAKLLIIEILCNFPVADKDILFNKLANKGSFQTVNLIPGYSGGGIEPTYYTSCKVTEIKVMSEQGCVVKTRIRIIKNLE